MSGPACSFAGPDDMTVCMIKTKIPGFTIHHADENDISIILELIKSLAAFEKLSNEVVATEDQLKRTIFGKDRHTDVIIGRFNDKPVAFALYFHNYSTFLARPGIYLEDLFVIPEFRNKGFGRTMLAYIAKIAKERSCGRFEWAVLDWNDNAIRFYKKLGAQPLSEWTIFRMAGESISDLAGQF